MSHTNKTFALYGYISGKKDRPSFISPVFISNGHLYSQLSNNNSQIIEFKRIKNDDIINSVQVISIQIIKTIGDSSLFGFKFENNEVFFSEINKMKEMLRHESENVKKFPFTYLEIMEFIEDISGQKDAIKRISKKIAINDKALATKFSNLHMSQLIKNQRGNKNVIVVKIGYHEVFPQIELLIKEYSSLKVNLIQCRSLIGKSKKIKNIMLFFGFKNSSINTESHDVIINSNNINKLKQINNLVIIKDVIVSKNQKISMSVIDPIKIMKKYKKKDHKKNVQREIFNDYVFSYLEE